MNQKEIGKYIAKKRKEKNLTQSQLAERLGVASKTVSKWETGVSMPDYSIVETLCRELSTTPSQLIAGTDEEAKTITSDDKRILFLLKRLQDLNNQNKLMFSLLLIVLAIALLGISLSLGGSAIKEFSSGMLTGISIVLSGVGIFSLTKALKWRK
jgi:transcriptional regulator with XRE-family HTH domain